MDDSLAKDLVAMWQSELTAMAADREMRETWAGLMALWARTTTSILQTMPPRSHDAARGTHHAEPARPASADAAFEPGVAEVQQLNRRIAELEQRLAELERGRADHS